MIASTGRTRANAIVSLLIGTLILPRTWWLLREAVAGHFSVEHSTFQLELAGHRHLLGERAASSTVPLSRSARLNAYSSTA
jgi:hypothetical protein